MWRLFALALAGCLAVGCSRRDQAQAPPGSDADNAAQIKHYPDEQDIGDLKAQLTTSTNARVAPKVTAPLVATLPAGMTVLKAARRQTWFLIEFAAKPDGGGGSGKLLAAWVPDKSFAAAHAHGAKKTALTAKDCDCWKKNAAAGTNCNDVHDRKDCDRSFEKDCAKWYPCMVGDLTPTCAADEQLVTDPDGTGGVCVPIQSVAENEADAGDDDDDNPTRMPTVLDNP